MNDHCIFCRIANGEIPTACIYEDDLFKVILDNAPSALGHALILPKRHADTLYELDEESAKALFPVVQKIAGMLKDTLKPDGINILQNNGEAAGQTVSHFHVHVIPRFNGDAVHIGWPHQQLTPEQFKEMAQRMQANS